MDQGVVFRRSHLIRLHVPSPTLSDAHNVRMASAFRKDRRRVQESLWRPFPAFGLDGLSRRKKKSLAEDLHRAVSCAFLCAFMQGINAIDQADQENKWAIDFAAVIQIWRNGCIIRSDHIADLLSDIFSPS